MKCPSCDYDNKPDALTCNLCQTILRREKAAPPVARPPLSEPVVPVLRGPRPPFPIGLLLLGTLFFVVGTMLSCRQYRRASFPEVPRNMTQLEMVAHQGYAFTRFDREQVLRDQGVYRRRDAFFPIDPRVGFETANPRDIVASKTKLLNTYVKLTNPPPFLQSFTLVSKKIHFNGGAMVQEEVVGYRLFAPVLGSNGALWVASQFHQTEPKTETFTRAASYAGTLLPLRDLLKSDTYSQLQHAYSPGAATIPASAVVIAEGPAPSGENVSAWYPLGSIRDLFVEVPDDADLDLDYSEGVLDEPLSQDARARLQAALDKRGGAKIALPARVRAIILTTPSDFKEARGIGGKWNRFYLGLLALGAVLLGIAALQLRQIFAA